MSTCLIFGGSGFIGTNLIYFFLKHNIFNNIIVCDLNEKIYSKDILIDNAVAIKYLYCDVRREIDLKLDSNVNLIINLAAIHREPGHNDFEFYETNLLGAQNVTNFAETIGCNNLFFTSSISPYGDAITVKDEKTLPVPTTPYGTSKLIAEKIHQIWQARDKTNRRLLIVRPGVVYGPGEGGNVSRLIKSVLKNYFFYVGNKSTRKAGVYVKELCNAMWWVFQDQIKNGERVSLFNMTINPSPSINDYVDTICKVKGFKRKFYSIPYKFLLASCYVIEFFLRPFKINHPFSPVRIRKLVYSNNIIPSYLLEHGYQYEFTLESSFLDWKKSSPKEWC